MNALRDYVPGQHIYSGFPYVQVVRKESRLCANCCDEDLPLKSCQKCMSVRYCSKKCQKESWSDHKLVCGLLKNLPENQQLMIYLTGLLILKIKGKPWEDIYEVVDGRKVTFAGLITHVGEMKMDSRLLLYLKEMKVLLEEFIGSKNMPKDEDLWKIIGKVQYNQLSFGENLNSPNVHVFYLHASNIDHSCIPNAEFNVRDRKLIIQAIAEIHKGEKITVSYLPLVCYPGSFLKSGAVMKSFFSSCQCEDCSKPYGTSVLSKIIDDSKAFSVVEESENFLKAFETLHALDLPIHLESSVDYILRKQEGVLGNTHILHLRVLALKCFFMDINLSEKRMEITKLLQYMKKVYGNYHKEVRKVYCELLMTNLYLYDFLEVGRIQKKMDEYELMFY